MIYQIYYGDICEKWAKNWGTENPDDNPFKVLENDHAIVPRLGEGWLGFHFWADECCTDRIEIDWGSRAWKCTGKALIDLSRKWPDSVYNVDSVDPDKTYGVVFIEMS